jgi:hypothetical protein
VTRKYLPQAPAGMPGIWASVVNMLPCRSGAYAPGNLFTTKVTAGPATPGTTKRWWCALLPDETAISYIGTTTKLWQYDGTSTFTDRSGAAYSTAVDWSFAQFGNITFAVDRVDAVQTRDSTGVANFANATGSPPKATIVVTQAEQVMLLNLNDGAEKPDAFATCAPGDHTDWSGAGATTATRVRHRPGGFTAAVAFRDYVLAFKKSSVYRITYSGNNTFKWKVELIAIGRGAYGKHDVVNCGDVVVFNGPGGSWTYDGASFRSITDLVGDIYPTGGASVAGFFLPASQRVYFGSLTGYSVYNLVSDRWGSQNLNSTTAALANTYRPLTGDPAALSAFSSSVIGITYPDVTWLADLSSNPCVVKADTNWGGGTTFTGSDAYLYGTFDGGTGDQVVYANRLDLRFANTLGSIGVVTPPGATELLLDAYTASSTLDAPTLAQSSVASSTAQRRFDVGVSGVFLLPKIRMPIDSGYTEIDDYDWVMKPAGKL